MKLIIAGSRTFVDYHVLCATLAPLRPQIAQVITGGARGADQMGHRWAAEHGLPQEVFQADWARFGKGAGPRRNRVMAEAGDRLVAFWDGLSRGTADMILRMLQYRKPTQIVWFREEEAPGKVRITRTATWD
jgi:hypothetical protein